jgi:hypothetical protein
MVSTTDAQICRQIEEALVQDPRTKDAAIDMSCLGGW